MWLMNYRKIWVKYRWSLELWRFLDLFQLFPWIFSKALQRYRVSPHQIPSKKSNILWKSWKMRIYRNCFPLIQRYVWIKNQAFLLVYFDFVFFKFLSLNFRWKLQPEMVQMAILKRAKLLSTTTRNCAEKKLNVFLHISISKTLVKCQLTFLMVPMATKVFAGIYRFQI